MMDTLKTSRAQRSQKEFGKRKFSGEPVGPCLNPANAIRELCTFSPVPATALGTHKQAQRIPGLCAAEFGSSSAARQKQTLLEYSYW